MTLPARLTPVIHGLLVPSRTPARAVSLLLSGVCVVAAFFFGATASAELTSLASTAFDYRYEFDQDPTDPGAVDLDSNALADWAVSGSTALGEDGDYLIIGPTEAGGSGQLTSRAVGTYWTQEGLVWPTTACPADDGPFTMEVSLKVLRDDDPNFGACMVGISGSGPENAAVWTRGVGQRWGSSSSTFALPDQTNSDSGYNSINTDDYHAFRIAMESPDAWWVWRDGVLLNPGGEPLSAAYAHSQLVETIRIGDPGSVVDGQVQVDYVRFTEGAYAPETTELQGRVVGEFFGGDIAVDGDVMVVGAPYYGSSRGRILLFERDTTTGNWVNTTRKTSANAGGNDRFGMSVALEGNTMMFGSVGGNEVVVMQPDTEGAWQIVDTITGNGGSFGFDIDMSGGTTIVGAYGAKEAYIYESDGAGDWDASVVTLSSSAGYYGVSVAVDQDTAVVGAIGSNRVMIYGRDEGGAGAWGLAAQLDCPTTVESELFGRRVDIEGDTLVVGAEKAGDQDQGAVYIYERDEFGVWNQTARLIADDGELDDHFGYRLDLDGDKLLVGTQYAGSDDAGAAYLFGKNTEGTWELIEKLLSPEGEAGDYFGYGVALDGETMMIGAPNAGAGGTVYTQYVAPEPEDPAVPGDLDGDGFVGSSDLDIVRAGWGQSVTPGDLLAGDPSGDGIVGSADLDIVRGNWGLGSPASVPEPGTCVLIACLVLLGLPRVRRRS